MTPGELAELANCRPQMIYNYIHDNRIKAIINEESGHYVIEADVAEAWLEDYRKRKAERKAKQR
jgi:hypothetical protein